MKIPNVIHKDKDSNPGIIAPDSPGCFSVGDLRAIEETRYLSSIPGMRESIQIGMATPLEECCSEIEL